MTTLTEPMLAYHGKPAIKRKYIARVRRHREMDELIRGTGWDETSGRGCAVGCTLNKYDHAAYETELGIPRAIARLEDGLFESLPRELAMQWPERFLKAIKPGADLSLVLPKWFVWMLADPAEGVLRFAKTERSRAAIKRVADLYQQKIDGRDVKADEFRSDAAAYAAADAADAADAAYAAYAADAAYADAAAYAAAYAAYAAAADAAYAAARTQCRIKQADKLVELLEAA